MTCRAEASRGGEWGEKKKGKNRGVAEKKVSKRNNIGESQF